MPKVPGSISFLAIDYQGLDYLYLDSDGQGRGSLADFSKNPLTTEDTEEHKGNRPQAIGNRKTFNHEGHEGNRDHRQQAIGHRQPLTTEDTEEHRGKAQSRRQKSGNRSQPEA